MNGYVVVFTAPKTVDYQPYELPPLAANQVRLRTLYSGISAGTELTAYRGTNPYMHKRWDAGRRLFVPAEEPGLAYPIAGWGYEEVGEVIEVGEEAGDVSIGDLVYGAWGHRSHHSVDATYARQRRLPPSLEPLLGIFSQIGAIALNGVHDAAIRIGETVAIFGLGVPGQIVAQLASASGARVIGVDLHDRRLAMAGELGAVDLALNVGRGQIAEQVRAWTDGRGADVAIEVSGAAAALHEATRAVAYSARVIAMGFFQGEAGRLYLGEEFHHNRVSIVGSQISGVNPELSYRWNELRLAQTAMRLQADGVLNLQPLISHTFPVAEASEAFRLLDEAPEEVVQVVLDFGAL